MRMVEDIELADRLLSNPISSDLHQSNQTAFNSSESRGSEFRTRYRQNSLHESYQATLTECFHLKFLDRHLVGKVSSSEFSEEWHKKFAQHPSWCDADICLQQINEGRAVGNRVALYSRAFFQQLLFSLGEFIQEWPRIIIIIGLIFLAICCLGLRDVHIETDLVKLWVEEGGRLEEELGYLDKARRNYYYQRTKRMAVNVHHAPPEIPVENNFGGGFQVVIQTNKDQTSNILTKEGLLTHVKILEEIAQYNISMFGESWFLSDICFKPPPPRINAGPVSNIIESMVANIIPCVWITPVDCFWEGSKPLGPFPPINLEGLANFIPSLPKGPLSWKNLNPELLLNDTAEIVPDIQMISDLFERAGIGAAYQDRPCIDPLDLECPKTSPNYFNRCKAFEKFNKWNEKLPMSQRIKIEEELPPTPSTLDVLNEKLMRQPREALATTDSPRRHSTNTSGSKIPKADEAEYYDNDDDVGPTTESPEEKNQKHWEKECRKYEKSFVKWLEENYDKWTEFMDHKLLPVYPDYSRTLTGGCKGFGKKIMSWPEDLIVGGVKRHNDALISHAEAFQTVFLVASPSDVYHRFSGSTSRKYNLKRNSFSSGDAGAIIAAWQRNFTKLIYDHSLNDREGNIRIIHPLASTSIQDMLSEFSEFKFNVIFIGYILMIIYAGWSQVEWDRWWFSSKSSCFLAIIGVLVVTYASVAGLGLSTFFGIHFNAATTQIVPFLTLGLGIDDMFLLLHNYGGVIESVKRKEIAILLKETGMSVLITSINNILAFLTGTILPIPALRSFCGQTAILLTANVICIILIYPAFIALDLIRRKALNRDMTIACCYAMKGDDQDHTSSKKMTPDNSRNQLVKSDSMQSNGIILKQMSSILDSPPTGHQESETSLIEHHHKWYTLEGFLHGIYIPLIKKPITKASIIIICTSMFFFGCIGLYNSRIGLELADVLPENTAPSAFLKARERYFSFYPMFIVVKGENLGIPNNQMTIERLRKDIGTSDFVIKVDGKTEPYWMIFMRSWVHSLQRSLDNPPFNLTITDDAKIREHAANNFTVMQEFLLARQLLCSRGLKFDCSAKTGMNLIHAKEGFEEINVDSFYNILTAWYNQDNMMYYVSQAAFFPPPPPWTFNATSSLQNEIVPPAYPLIYSQIPFYMKDLTDTSSIVRMIKEIRSVCDKYSDQGFSVFPSGIPFTFWEQYLKLTYYLIWAIIIIAVAVLLVISIIIFNPWAAAMVAIIVVSMTVELAGFMGLFGVKLNPISAVTLITAVGIGVEFTAHVVLAFLTSLGTGDERMVSCLEHMFIPVIHGGLSTLLGIIMLAFSEFDFVIKYFFVVMSALIIIGLINGLAFLPVLLSIIGPPCEISPIDGGKTLLLRSDNKNLAFNAILPETLHESKTAEQASRSSPCGLSYDEAHRFHDSLSTLYETSGEERTGNATKNTPSSPSISTLRL